MSKTRDNDGWLDTTSTKERRILDLRSIGMRRALTLGRFHYNQANQELREQCHDAWLVLIFVLSGNQHYRLDRRELEIHGGQGLRVLPGQHYSTGGRPEQRGDLAWLILKTHPQPCGRALGMSPEGVRATFQRLMAPEHSSVFDLSTTMRGAIQRAFQAWPKRADPLALEIIRNQVAALVLEAATAVGEPRKPSAPSANAVRIDRVIDWLEEHLSDPLTAELLAERSGLSPARFFAEFKKRTGTSPKDYLLRLRIDTAAQRLRDDESISVTDIAHELGFSSSQYFSTVFRRYKGTNPSAWR